MPNINLHNVKIVYSTCSKFPDRQFRLESQLKDRGYNYEKYEGEVTETQWIGSCTNHKNILEKNLDDKPLFVLEDDVIFTKNFNHNIRYPDNTDAIYLGKSYVNLKESRSYNNQDYTKLIFSFGLHGILYLTPNFKHAMYNAFVHSLNKCVICDRVTGDLLKDYNVISPKKCWLYQENANNIHNKLATEYET